jgi:hypothetical protein
LSALTKYKAPGFAGGWTLQRPPFYAFNVSFLVVQFAQHGGPQTADPHHERGAQPRRIMTTNRVVGGSNPSGRANIEKRLSTDQC